VILKIQVDFYRILLQFHQFQRRSDSNRFQRSYYSNNSPNNGNSRHFNGYNHNGFYQNNRYEQYSVKEKKKYEYNNNRGFGISEEINKSDGRSSQQKKPQHINKNLKIVGSNDDEYNEYSMEPKKRNDSNKLMVYLGNVKVGLTFDKIEELISKIYVGYTDLIQLKTKHRFFQSYSFNVEKDKVSEVFNSKKWSNGLVLRKFKTL
jgi:hypothetical protein